MNNAPENTEPQPAPPPDRPHDEPHDETSDLTSVVIVSCNRVNALRASLTALNAAVQDTALQVIVIDNGSTDGSARLDADFPAAQFVRLPQNFGLTKALNIGIRATDGNHILLLHDDVEITPVAIALLVEELKTHPETGGACPLLLDESGNPAPQIRDLPSTGNPDPPFRAGKPGDVPAVRGAIMVRRFLLNALRHVDERYGNYGSDIELSMQVKRANKKIVVVDGATAIHHSQPPETAAVFVADRQLGTAAFLGKYFGFFAKLQYLLGAILGALFTLRLGRLRYLVAGEKIEGA